MSDQIAPDLGDVLTDHPRANSRRSHGTGADTGGGGMHQPPRVHAGQRIGPAAADYEGDAAVARGDHSLTRFRLTVSFSRPAHSHEFISTPVLWSLHADHFCRYNRCVKIDEKRAVSSAGRCACPSRRRSLQRCCSQPGYRVVRTTPARDRQALPSQ